MGSVLGCDPKSDVDDNKLRQKPGVVVAAASQSKSSPTASFNTGVFGNVPDASLKAAAQDVQAEEEEEVIAKEEEEEVVAASEPGLRTRKVGKSDLETSVFGLGTWQFGCAGKEDYWGTLVDQKLATSLVKASVDAGITYIDTAEVYGTPHGTSETQVGAAVKELNLNGKVIIGSKLPPQRFEEVEKALDETLKRLGIECIDLYMVHWPITPNAMAHFKAHDMFGENQEEDENDKNQKKGLSPTEMAFKALKKCQDAGKIKHIGVSNYGVKQLKEALATGVKIAVNQLCYNLLFRAIEFEIEPFCKENGIGIFAYSPLMQAILTGKWKTPDEVPDYRWRTRHFNTNRSRSRHGEPGHEDLTFSTLAELQKIADREKIPLADLALAWPLSNPNVACVIGGATKPSQIERNIRAFKDPLRPELVKELNDATEKLKQAMGKNADLWQGGDNTRIE